VESFPRNRRVTLLARAFFRTLACSFGAVTALALVACGDDTSPGAADGGESPGDAGAFDAGAGPDASSFDAGALARDGSIACGAGSLAAGDETVMLEIDGRTRTFHVHVPASYDGSTAVPLVLDFHGYTSNATQQIVLSGMNTKADEEGFVVIHPEGVGAAQSWNGGLCCGDAASMELDDVAFARAMVDEVAERGCIDRSRVYATGMSNGGFMSHRLGCEAADVFAAIAPVAGVLGISGEDCEPSRPVPVMHFHGTADLIVPYDGGGLVGFPSVAASMAVWADADGCTGEPSETFEMGNSTCLTHSSCEGGVEVTTCTVEGFGHWWPGAPGGGSSNIDATDAMWEFFERYSL
jgi:polyhydroxybutyrate depolymerase